MSLSKCGRLADNVLHRQAYEASTVCADKRFYKDTKLFIPTSARLPLVAVSGCCWHKGKFSICYWVSPRFVQAKILFELLYVFVSCKSFFLSTWCRVVAGSNILSH